MIRARDGIKSANMIRARGGSANMIRARDGIKSANIIRVRGWDKVS